MGRTDSNALGRVFIVSDSDYPGLDATSNYIRNFAKSLAMAGIDTKIVSVDRSANRYKKVKWKKEDTNIACMSLAYPVFNKAVTFVSRYSFASRVWKELKETGINSNDRVIVYSQKYAIVNAIVDRCRKNRVKVSAIVVEWFEGKDKNQDKCFEIAYPKCDSIIAISKNIKNYFDALGLSTMILPPMVDMSQCKTSVGNTSGDKVHFLYTGNFVGKDDMQVMLKALSLLPDEIRSKIEFHVTRFDDDSLIKASGIDEMTWSEINDVIFTHGDVTAEELNKLLQMADFLPIARQKNRTTVSNFPSKVPEAMMSGIVPIMTKVGDCPNDYLSDGIDSILFEECTSECCAKAYIRAVECIGAKEKNGTLAELKNGAYNTAKKRFDITIYQSSLVDFILGKDNSYTGGNK